MTTATTTTTAVNAIINAVWITGIIAINKSDALGILKDNNAKSRIVEEGIVVSDNGKELVFSRTNTPPCDNVPHKYIMPDFADDVRCLIQRSLAGEGSANIALYGMAGTGKSEFVHEIANEYGIRVYQVNGSEGLTGADFYGTMSVAVDDKTGQNYTYFEKGPLYRAFIEGTKVDENGNQVFDENGEPIVIGNPAIFFLDEFAAMLPEVFLGVFNRVLEIPRIHGKGRTMEVTMDSGRVVKSHPAMMVFLAGNTVGTGNDGQYQMGYTAQSNHMDESTRNRITAFYRFGYNKVAERTVILGMINDDFEADRFIRFRDNVRTLFKAGDVNTLFTTRSIVASCDMARALRKSKRADWMADAIRVAVYNGLPESDKPAFNEVIRMIYGKDFASIDSASKDYDYL